MKDTMKTKLLSGFGVLTLCGVISGICAAQPGPEVTLMNPVNGQRGPSDAVQLSIANLTDALAQQLALELDEVDISSLVNVQGDKVIFNPPQPLASGKHQLRLVQNLPNGDIQEIGVWTLVVRKSTSFSEKQLQSNISLGVNKRLADSNLTEPKPNSLTANGAAAFQGVLADGNWRLLGQLNLLVNSQRQLLPQGQQGPYIDVGTFLFTLQAGPVVAQAGQHSPIPNSLIFAGLQQRGVSVDIKSEDKQLGMTLFGVRAQDVIGTKGGLGIGDSENLISGVNVSAQPIGNASGSLLMMATYLSGKDPGAIITSTGVAQSVTGPAQGSAGDVLVDSQFLEKRMRIRGEYARTKYDSDGNGRDTNGDGIIDSNLDPVQDSAHVVTITYTPWHEKIVAGSPIAWNLGMEQNTTGTFFKSIAAPSAPSDHDGVRAFSDVTWAGLSVQASIGSSTDNVNHLDQLPRTRTDQQYFSTMYSPAASQTLPASGKPAALPWYGQASYAMVYSDTSQTVEQGGGAITTGPLSDNSSIVLAARFQYTRWNWGATYTVSDNADKTNMQGSVKSHSLDLSAGLMFANKLSLTPKLTYTQIRPYAIPVGSLLADYDNILFSLNVSYPFTQKINSTLTYTQGQKKTPCGCQDDKTTDITAGLQWNAIPMAQGKYSMNLSLDGSYHHDDNKTFIVIQPASYQIFLRMNIAWAPQL
jgi:hypothetical protein